MGLVMAFAGVFLAFTAMFAAVGLATILMRRPAAAPAAGGH
jgi:hypothetical protein